MASLFTKIILGEIPSYGIYEDEFVKAFLDIQPIHLGHTLVVPKIEVDQNVDLPEPYLTRVHQAAQKIARAIREATGAPRVGEAVVGFEVPHFHLHLIPLWSPKDLDFSRAKKRSDSEMKEIQSAIRQILAQA